MVTLHHRASSRQCVHCAVCTYMSVGTFVDAFTAEDETAICIRTRKLNTRQHYNMFGFYIFNGKLTYFARCFTYFTRYKNSFYQTYVLWKLKTLKVLVVIILTAATVYIG